MRTELPKRPIARSGRIAPTAKESAGGPRWRISGSALTAPPQGRSIRRESVIPLYFHFEFRGRANWEALGSGEGDGAHPVSSALEDLRKLHGGDLPAGKYRCIAARGPGARWQVFELDDDGHPVD
jgi:hypothetical protein